MSSVEQKDLENLLLFILQTEKQAYKENPMPNSEEKRVKIKEYSKKVEEITQNIARREGIKYEN